MNKKKQRNDEDMKWSILASEQLINRPWMKARRDTVQLPNEKFMMSIMYFHIQSGLM